MIVLLKSQWRWLAKKKHLWRGKMSDCFVNLVPGINKYIKNTVSESVCCYALVRWFIGCSVFFSSFLSINPKQQMWWKQANTLLTKGRGGRASSTDAVWKKHDTLKAQSVIYLAHGNTFKPWVSGFFCSRAWNSRIYRRRCPGAEVLSSGVCYRWLRAQVQQSWLKHSHTALSDRLWFLQWFTITIPHPRSLVYREISRRLIY